MKAVILAGGYGTRISEETGLRPKPMVEIGGRPILWHIMKLYSAHGVNEFVILCGYKGHAIKEYFANYSLTHGNVTIDLRQNRMRIESPQVEPWRVHLVETGEHAMTGGRLKVAAAYIGDDTFFLTYGDCVSNVNLTDLLAFHRSQAALVTLTAVQPPGRFGALSLHPDENLVSHFKEKPDGDGVWINGGFFVVEPGALDYVADEMTTWEGEPLESMATDGKLAAYRHHGYWQNMDTLRDKMILEQQWSSGEAPWVVW
jgi:glucose-1-phosphate cytidylyltransferase